MDISTEKNRRKPTRKESEKSIAAAIKMRNSRVS